MKSPSNLPIPKSSACSVEFQVTIRPDGVGEVIYVRDGSRRCVPARSEDGQEIKRDEEVLLPGMKKELRMFAPGRH